MYKMKRVINCIVPITVCNCKCHYCYIGQTNSFQTDVPKMNYSNEFITKALSVKRMGGPCLINLCGMGETMMAPYLNDLVKKLLTEGHFVSIVTNGTISKRLEELCKFDEELKKHLFVKFSFQYLELKRQNILDQFIKNVNMIKDAKISFTLELTVNDESIPHVKDIKKVCMDNFGALCHVIESRNITDPNYDRLTKKSIKEHQSAWNEFDSPLFKFQQSLWMKHQKNFCYAGDWILNFYLQNGELTPCFGGGERYQNLYNDLSESIHPFPIGYGQTCPWTHCFAAHILLTTGAIPNIKSPTYAEVRNRICSDGTEWLQPEVKEFFSSRLVDSNQEYSEKRKYFIDKLRKQDYSYDEKIKTSIENYLIENNIKTIGICGYDNKSKWLLDILKTSKIRIKYYVEFYFEESTKFNLIQKTKQKVKYLIKSINSNNQPIKLNKHDLWPKVDAIIVSDFNHSEEYLNLIHKKTKNKTLLLNDLVK